MRFPAMLILAVLPSFAYANPPVAAYIFPAGGQRGTKVNVRVGGLFLHEKCGFEMLGQGITSPKFLTRTKTAWFEGPILPLPDSQRQEDYPKDMAGTIAVAPDALSGVRHWRLWTSQGTTSALKFVVGELPELVEEEIDGDPLPVPIALPITINGRIFPREDVDIYAFRAKKGEAVRCDVNAARLGSPLDARLEIRDAQGRRLAESDAAMTLGGDPVIRFIAPADGEYQLRIDDVRTQGGQAFVYRLTVSAEPFVDHIFPLGGRRGSDVNITLFGHGVPAKQPVTIPADAPSAFTFSAHAKTTTSITLDTDTYTEYLAPKDFAQAISLPAILNGRIEKPGQLDEWKIQAKKGDIFDVELRAARLGSKLDGVISITDSASKEIARAEATTSDPSLRFQPTADGEYRVQVQDRFRSRGGLDFAYRLRIAPPPAPDFRLTFPIDAVTVLRKGTGKLKLNVERIGGFKEPIAIEIQGLPANVSFTPIVIPANQVSVDLTLKAEETAKIDVARLTILGTTKDAKRTATLVSVRGQPDQTSVLLAIALPTPFILKGEYDMGFAARGGMHKRKYTIERNGYNGPIEVSLADRQARHLQGVEGPMFTVPAGVSEFTYSAYLPPWMETGRTCRVCVQGVGVIKEPDGSEHRVSFSSVNQNEQLVAVVGPGKLALETDRTSFAAIPGKSFEIAVRIKRGQGVVGPVELDILASAHMRGITAAKVTIAAKDERGTLIVTCAGKLTGPFNMPIIVRATLRQNGEPIVAEVKLDVQP